jgi:hypothetical protein
MVPGDYDWNSTNSFLFSALKFRMKDSSHLRRKGAIRESFKTFKETSSLFQLLVTRDQWSHRDRVHELIVR